MCGATLTALTLQGSTNTYDLLTALIVEAVHLGVAPHVPTWRLEMTPVDHVSKGVIALGEHDDPTQHIYHLGDSHPTPSSEVFDRLGELGYKTERVGWNEWVALWQKERGNAKGGLGGFTVDVLRSGMPSAEYLSGIIALRDDKTRPLLDGLVRPQMDAKLLATYARCVGDVRSPS